MFVYCLFIFNQIYLKTARPLIANVFRRGKATCFAYGQTGMFFDMPSREFIFCLHAIIIVIIFIDNYFFSTYSFISGSGKTFTMMGSNGSVEHQGLYIQASRDIFSYLARAEYAHLIVVVRFSFIFFILYFPFFFFLFFFFFYFFHFSFFFFLFLFFIACFFLFFYVLLFLLFLDPPPFALFFLLGFFLVTGFQVCM